MKLYFLLFVLSLDFGDLTFLHDEKVPIFYCLKVCPLYCSKREKRDVDYSPIYWDEDEKEHPFPPFIEDHDEPFHGHSLKHWKKKTTEKITTTVKTTTENPKPKLHHTLPHFIEDYDSAFNSEPYYYIKHWKKTTTEKATTTVKTTTEKPKPILHQSLPHFIEDYDSAFNSEPYYYIKDWKTTKKPTTTTTTEGTDIIHLNPVFIDVHDVTFEVPPFYHWDHWNHWKTTTEKPTTTTEATTTKKTTFICALCIKKCGNLLHST